MIRKNSMQNKKCDICNTMGLVESKKILGFCYCASCNNFLYHGDKTKYPIHVLLREILQISHFPDILVSDRSIGMIADLCEKDNKTLAIFAKIVFAGLIDMDEMAKVIKQPQSLPQYIIIVSRQIEQTLAVDYDYCEYIIRLLVFALGYNVSTDVPDLSTSTENSHFIKFFKQSSAKVLKGHSVEFQWDVRGKNIRIYLQVGEKTYAIKNPRASKRIVFDDNQKVVLVVRSKVNQQEIARRSLSVTVIEEVELTSFEASKPVCIESSPIILSWKVKNASRILLLPDQVDVTKVANITVRPNTTTTYILKASNDCSSKEKKCLIRVRLLPVIERVKLPVISSADSSLISISLPSIHVTSPQPNISIGNACVTPRARHKQSNIILQKRWVEAEDFGCIIRNIKSLFTYFQKLYKYEK